MKDIVGELEQQMQLIIAAFNTYDGKKEVEAIYNFGLFLEQKFGDKNLKQIWQDIEQLDEFKHLKDLKIKNEDMPKALRHFNGIILQIIGKLDDAIKYDVDFIDFDEKNLTEKVKQDKEDDTYIVNGFSGKFIYKTKKDISKQDKDKIKNEDILVKGLVIFQTLAGIDFNEKLMILMKEVHILQMVPVRNSVNNYRSGKTQIDSLNLIQNLNDNCNECEKLLKNVIKEEIKKTKNLILAQIVKNTMQENMDIRTFKVYKSVTNTVKKGTLTLDDESLKYIIENNINPALINAMNSHEKINNLHLTISNDDILDSVSQKLQKFKKEYETASCQQAFAFNSDTASIGQKIGYYLSTFFGPSKVSNWIENTFFSTHQKSVKRLKDSIDNYVNAKSEGLTQ